MDSQGRDDSRIRQREATLARRVGEALDRLSSQGAGACPDAGIIAAYSDEALSPSETAQWEGHFATCARCRKILRVLAASSEAPLAEREVAQLGELISAARPPGELVGGKSAFRKPRPFADWRMRWLAPALGAAAVLAVWFAVRPPWRADNPGDTGNLIAQAPKGEAPRAPSPENADRLPGAEAQQDLKTTSPPQPDSPSPNARSLNAPSNTFSKHREQSANETAQGFGDARKSAGSAEEKKELAGIPERNKLQSAQIPLSSPAPPQAKDDQSAQPSAPVPQPRRQPDAQAAPSTRETPGSTNQSVVVTEAAPQVETTSGALSDSTRPNSPRDLPLNGRNVQALTASRATRQFTILLKSTSGATLWRAGQGGAIERSTDAATTWAAQESPAKEDWLAGAAVSDTVCWLVGRNGAIGRTADGLRWETIAPPPLAANPAGKFPDWVGVAAQSAGAATVTASDQRRYATQDGGKTWQAQ